MSDDALGYEEPGSPTHVFDVESLGGSPEKVRERVQIAGSGTTLAEVARVRNSQPGVADYGVVVRPVAPFATRADTYTTADDGTTVDRSTAPVSKFALQVVGTGDVPIAWDVRLEGSLDGTNWVEILRHTSSDGNKAIISTPSPFPVLYLRSRCEALTLGLATNVVVTLLGMP